MSTAPWIHPQDALPKQGQRVLVWRNEEEIPAASRIALATFEINPEDGPEFPMWHIFDGWSTHKVSHGCALPEAPQR